MICLRGSFVVGLHFYKILGNHTNVDFFFKKKMDTRTHTTTVEGLVVVHILIWTVAKVHGSRSHVKGRQRGVATVSARAI